MTLETSSKRLKLSTLKLNTLLVMAQTISESMSTSVLLERFRTILNDDLDIDRVAFFKLEESWELILSTNCTEKIISSIDIEKDLLPYNDVTFISTSLNSNLQEFDIIVPVMQNQEALAYILIADTKDAKGVSSTIRHLNFVQTLSIITFVAIENLRLFQNTLEQEAMKKELELASKMQNMLIPSQNSLPQSNELKIYSYYNPHYDVGGDFYDVIQLSKDEIGFCIADVSGKGISAALLMSNFQANLRALFTNDITLTGLIEKLNDRVMRTAKGERFITIFIGRYNPTRKHLEYINAGHNPPALYRMDSKQLSFLSDGCVGLGMLDDIPLMNVGSLRIMEPTKLICYTDGLVEYILNDRIEYGTSIIENNIANNHSVERNVEDIIQARIDLNQKEKVGFFDDISILGFELR